MFEPNIPPYPLAARVALANKMSRRAMITKLAGVGILERHGGRWCVAKSRLRARLADVYDALWEFESKEQEAAAKNRRRQETAGRPAHS